MRRYNSKSRSAYTNNSFHFLNKNKKTQTFIYLSQLQLKSILIKQGVTNMVLFFYINHFIFAGLLV